MNDSPRFLHGNHNNIIIHELLNMSISIKQDIVALVLFLCENKWYDPFFVYKIQVNGSQSSCPVVLPVDP